jgi:Cys-tRNA(Pro)/Cys-tRNA(Cys) deacylase
MRTRVTRLLDEAGITYELKRHSRPVFTSPEAASERGVRVAQIIKTMIAETADGGKIAALVPGDRQLDWKKLRQACGQRRLTLVPRERIEAVTGYPPGAIAPVGLPGDFTLFADSAFLQETTVSISSGSPEAGLVLRREDLFRLLPVDVVDIAK